MPEANSSPKSSLWLVLCRTAVLVAIAASAALYVQYLDPADAAFCGLDSGCEAVRKSGFSYFGSPLLSVPLVGLVAYGSVLALSLFAPRSKVTLNLIFAGGAAAVLLIAAQAFYVHAFCWLCLVVDSSAILAAALAAASARGDGGTEPLPWWTWAGLAGLAVAAAPGWAASKPAPPVPSQIRALYVPDKINVVEFADFECPFCRAYHPVLEGVIKSYPPGEVHLVRKHVPLGAHEQAARAVICAEQQGKAEELGDRLVQIELSPTAIHRAAIEIGVDGAKLDRCLATSDPDRRIEADTKLLVEVGMQGLPTTYVGGKRLLGAVSEDAVRDAFERAKRGSSGGVPGPLYAAALVAAVAGLVWLGRRTHGTV
jgi:protein-disulfide isomerase